MPLKEPPKGTQSQYAGSIKGRTQKNKKLKETRLQKHYLKFYYNVFQKEEELISAETV